jgi:hypothetical protein
MARIMSYYMSSLSYKRDTQIMKYLKFLRHSGSETKILTLDDTRDRIEPYDAKSSVTAHGAGSQVTSHSSGSPLGHINLPQQS